jgi:hypothetical protein
MARAGRGDAITQIPPSPLYNFALQSPAGDGNEHRAPARPTPVSPDERPYTTPQERDLTTILLDRLYKTEGQKDPEAEALIRQATAEPHGAPHYLVQTVLIQDLSLHNAQSRISDLEAQRTETSPSRRM